MTSSKKWKHNLLSSSVPLEFEIAKALVSNGFSITPDYTYSRNDSGITKDFSVDMKASAYWPFYDPNQIKLELDILVECKYRSKNTKWLFLPEINKPDFSNVTLGHTLRVVDNFSPYFVSSVPSYEFEMEVSHCYKGIEIKSDGSVYGTELVHGVRQMQYALPQLLYNNILFNLGSHWDDKVPFVLSTIMVTTADLYVVKRRKGLKDFEKVGDIQEIAVEVPFLLFFSDYGPDFESHCFQKFRYMDDECDVSQLQKLDQICEQTEKQVFSFQYPSYVIQSLIRGERSELLRHFTQFFICSQTHFENLIQK